MVVLFQDFKIGFGLKDGGKSLKFSFKFSAYYLGKGEFAGGGVDMTEYSINFSSQNLKEYYHYYHNDFTKFKKINIGTDLYPVYQYTPIPPFIYDAGFVADSELAYILGLDREQLCRGVLKSFNNDISVLSSPDKVDFDNIKALVKRSIDRLSNFSLSENVDNLWINQVDFLNFYKHYYGYLENKDLFLKDLKNDEIPYDFLKDEFSALLYRKKSYSSKPFLYSASNFPIDELFSNLDYYRNDFLNTKPHKFEFYNSVDGGISNATFLFTYYDIMDYLSNSGGYRIEINEEDYRRILNAKKTF